MPKPNPGSDLLAHGFCTFLLGAFGSAVGQVVTVPMPVASTYTSWTKFCPCLSVWCWWAFSPLTTHHSEPGRGRGQRSCLSDRDAEIHSEDHRSLEEGLAEHSDEDARKAVGIVVNVGVWSHAVLCSNSTCHCQL